MSIEKSIYTKVLDYLEQIELKQVQSSKKVSTTGKLPAETTKIETSAKSTGFDVQKLETLMRDRLIAGYKKSQSYVRPYVSVGELLSCMRKNYFYRMGYAVDFTSLFSFAYLDLINEVSRKIHTYIQEIYDFSEVEKRITSERYKVRGRVDACKENFLYEIKTLDEEKFSGLVESHYHQGVIYAYILNSEYGSRINTITVIYVMRDNLRKIVSFDCPTNDSLAISFLERAPKFLQCLEKKVVPDPIGFSEDQCFFCEYKQHCQQKPAKQETESKPVFLI